MVSKNQNKQSQKDFNKMCVKYPRKYHAARKVCQGAFLAIAHEMIVDNGMEIKVGETIFPNNEFRHLKTLENEIENAIMNSEPGTEITLSQDGEDYIGNYHAFWRVGKQNSVPKKAKLKK